MNSPRTPRSPTPGLVLVFLLVARFASSCLAADSLNWPKTGNRIDADFDSASLRTVLAKISQATGWEIYLEPDAQRTVSVKFRNLPQGEALRRLLADLNFALLPQANSPSKLLIYRTSLQEATQRIPPAATEKHPERGRIIPNELIVIVKSDSKQKVDELAHRLGAKVIGAINELNAYRLQFKDAASAEAARQALAADPSLARIESNYFVDRPTPAERLQMSSQMPFSLKPKISTDASKIIVGLIDMAVQPLGEGMNDFLMPPIQVAGAPGHLADPLSHGTSMAETILKGLAVTSQEPGGSSVRILPVDVYGPREETSTFDVARGVYTAINNGATIVNLSMGGDGESKLLSGIIQQAYNSGVLFFGAAGNEPTTIPNFPAAMPEVVAVTAGDRRGNIAPYANRGSFVDVIAPGLSVVKYGGESYLVSGTSAATAYMSGAAAAFRAAGKQPAQVEAQIRDVFGVGQTRR